MRYIRQILLWQYKTLLLPQLSLTIATESQLQQLTLTKLKELAANHNIQGRSSMTKNLETAHKLLVPQLVGLVAVDEI